MKFLTRHGCNIHSLDYSKINSIATLVAGRLSDYKVPETMELTLEPLPRNANGKVMKRQLREASAAMWAAAQT